MALSREDLEQRIVELEIKASFAEDLLDHLNQTVAGQQQLIERLLRELRTLQRQLPAADGGTFRSLREELPPHY